MDVRALPASSFTLSIGGLCMQPHVFPNGELVRSNIDKRMSVAQTSSQSHRGCKCTASTSLVVHNSSSCHR